VGIGLSSRSRHPSTDHRRQADHDDGGLDDQLIDARRLRGTRLDVGLQQSRYTSPLPSPADLDRYATHVPDAAERLLAIGEREQSHRHNVEDRLVAIDEEAMPRFYAGQRHAHAISLILGLAYLAVMVLAIAKGYPLFGAGGAAFGIAAVVWSLRRDSSSADAREGGEKALEAGDLLS
jgi:uncharacterized membrane protein